MDNFLNQTARPPFAGRRWVIVILASLLVLAVGSLLVTRECGSGTSVEEVDSLISANLPPGSSANDIFDFLDTQQQIEFERYVGRPSDYGRLGSSTSELWPYTISADAGIIAAIIRDTGEWQFFGITDIQIFFILKISSSRTTSLRRPIRGPKGALAPQSSVGESHSRLAEQRDEPSYNRGMTTDPIETLRRLCLALPEVTERLSHGEPTWFVQGKKTFVTTSDHHHDDRVAFWCAAPAGAQEVLVGADPKRFFRPKYVGHRGWLGVYLDVPQDWDLIANLVADAYREVAPKRLVAMVNANH